MGKTERREMGKKKIKKTWKKEVNYEVDRRKVSRDGIKREVSWDGR